MSDDGTREGSGTATAPFFRERAGSDAIVVGVDGSPAAAAGVKWAWRQARATGRPVRIVHAWTMPSGVDATSPAHREAAEADARARATQWVEEAIGADVTSLRWVLDIVEGSAGPELVTVPGSPPPDPDLAHEDPSPVGRREVVVAGRPRPTRHEDSPSSLPQR